MFWRTPAATSTKATTTASCKGVGSSFPSSSSFRASRVSWPKPSFKSVQSASSFCPLSSLASPVGAPSGWSAGPWRRDAFQSLTTFLFRCLQNKRSSVESVWRFPYWNGVRKPIHPFGRKDPPSPPKFNVGCRGLWARAKRSVYFAGQTAPPASFNPTLNLGG